MKNSTEIQGYDIIVIQSLKVDDRKTGEELYNDIIKYKPFVRDDVYTNFYDVNSQYEFRELLNKIEENASSNHVLTLHFETHGCVDGIELSSSELISWKELFTYIRPINIKTSNLLMVVMSMCKGAAISSHIEPELSCPFRAFVGFEHDMFDNTLYEAFVTFYESYNNMLDVFAAIERANKVLSDGSKAWCMRAIDIFDKVLNPDTNPDSFDEVIDSNYAEYIKREGFITKEQFKEKVRQYFINNAKKYRKHYNFED